MRVVRSYLVVFLVGMWLVGIGTGVAEAQSEPSYVIAFAHFGPRNSDIFLADADGRNAKPLAPHLKNDYNASFSADGKWVVFTSHRKGSADIWRVRRDGWSSSLTTRPSTTRPPCPRTGSDSSSFPIAAAMPTCGFSI